MTTRPTVSEIERRLRMAAPDEPRVLPPLTLPPLSGAIARGGVRFLPGELGSPGLRPAVLVSLLLLALAAIVAAGALREVDRPRVDPLAAACHPIIAQPPSDTHCSPVAVPAGWFELGAGQLTQGDFTEEGLGYETVTLVMANVALEGCPSPGGPMPTAVPVGTNAFEMPAPTPDPGLGCVRTTPLPDNGIRVVTMVGSRILGVDDHGAGIPDVSEPTPEAGWTETVDGRPARLKVTTLEGPGRSQETRTWDILRPGSIDSILRITADIAGPDLDAGRAEVGRFIDAVDFKWTPPPLEESQRNDVLKGVLDGLDRDARERQSDLYGCFPRAPGTTEGVIRGTEGGPLARPLRVRCSSSIEPSLAGIWRIVLEVSWDATDGYPADTIRTQFFSTGERLPGSAYIDISGGFPTALSGRPMGEQGIASRYPNSSFELPPPLSGPLDLAPGSVVRVLAPGASLHYDPAGDLSGDAGVGTRLYVVGGQATVDGEEWYRVQASTLVSEDQWVPGTLDGRPLLEVIQPECPGEPVSVGDVTWLIPAERLLCLAGREIAFEQAVLEPEEGFPYECSTLDGGVGPCPTATGESAWITGRPWWLYGAGGSTGPEPGFLVWLDPAIDAPVTGETVRVRGHFDDPAAAVCRDFETIGPFGFRDEDPEFRLLACRERFVITSIDR